MEAFDLKSGLTPARGASCFGPNVLKLQTWFSQFTKSFFKNLIMLDLMLLGWTDQKYFLSHNYVNVQWYENNSERV